LAVSGCAGVSKIHKQPINAGIEKKYQAAAANVKELAKEAALKAKYTILEQKQYDPNTYQYILLMPMSMQSNGHYARVLIISEGANVTVVRFHNVRRIDMNFTENLEGPKKNFFSQLEAALISKQEGL
ncbi:MAG: hypothetical protein QM472_00350, partial [Spirochaetota bacterium]|nr:hypothetical protein [Spirochaetota bacterium]